MTAAAPSTSTKRIPMDANRKTALVAGTFYLLTFAASIPALLLLNSSHVLTNPDYIVGAGSDTRVLWGCLLDVVTALTGIGSAVALFPLVRKQNEATALGFVTSRMFEAAVIVIGVISLLSIVTLRHSHSVGTGTDAASLVNTGRSLVAVRNWTFLLGPAFMAAINALLLGSLMYRSRLVPRIIPTMGLIGAPLLLAAATATFFGLTEQTSTVSGIATLPVAAWEFSLGLWMTFKGFKPSPITALPSSSVETPRELSVV